jgi:hypothetical protein
LIVIIFNSVFGAIAYPREPLASYLAGAIAIVLQFLLWFAAVSIVRSVLA